MLVFLMCLGEYFKSSNKEPGNGRFDIQLKPENKNLPRVLIEITSGKNVEVSVG